MRQIIFYLFLLPLLLGCASLGKSKISADYVFENVHIIPMSSDIVLKDKALAIKDGTIIAILDQSESKRIKASHRVDGNSRYLMPGLSDMHVHTRWDPHAMFNLYIAHGITTVANMWSGDGDGNIDHLKLREQVAMGSMTGPRYLVSGAHFEGDFPKSLDEVAHLLDSYHEEKIDFIKIHGDLPEPIYKGIIAGAKKRNIKVIGHAQHARPLAKTLELDGLEHMEELLYVSRDQPLGTGVATDFLSAYRENVERLRNAEYRRLVVKDIADSGIYLDPTLIVYKMVGVWSSDEQLASLQNDPDIIYLPGALKEYWLSELTNPYQVEGFPINRDEVESNMEVMFMLTKELYDAGVPLLLGTDTFGTLIPGKSAHQELGLLVESGLSPFEALTCGTTHMARYLDEEHFAGKIEKGFRADFILLDRNPLVDIKNVSSVSGVFTHNRWHDQPALAELKRVARERLR